MTTRSPNYKWWVILMLWFICFFNYADRQAIFAIFPKLKTEFNFTDIQLGLIGSAFMFVYAAGAPIAGFICDRFPRKKLILGGCVFWSGITVLTGSCAKLWQFVTVRALEGLGETFYFPASMSLASDYHDPRTRSRALSFHQSSVYVGTILGSWLGAWFAEKLGWRVGFYFFGTAGLLLALILWRLLDEPPRGGADQPILPATSPINLTEPSAHLPPRPIRWGEGRGEGESYAQTTKSPDPLAAPTPPIPTQPATRNPSPPSSILHPLSSIFRTPIVPLLMLAFAAANFVATIFLTWTPTFLVEKFHFKLAAAGLSGTVFIHLASAVSVPVAGTLADKLTQRFPGGRMFIQALGLAVGAVFVFLVGNTASEKTLLAAMTAFGFCKGFYDSGIFASLYDAIEPRARGTAAGLMNTVGWGGGALGPLYVGWKTQYGGLTHTENMSQAIAFGATIYVLAALLVLTAMLLLKKEKVGDEVTRL